MTAGGNGKGGETESKEISTIPKLKSISKELNVPVIALSQLSRAVEPVDLVKTLLSDLRESVRLSKMPILYRFIPSEYYKIDEWMMMKPTVSRQAEIAKHRNGSIENVRLKFIGHLGKFDNLEDHSGIMMIYLLL
jgi:replicative DNA helicase